MRVYHEANLENGMVLFSSVQLPGHKNGENKANSWTHSGLSCCQSDKGQNKELSLKEWESKGPRNFWSEK